jgi:hypothetical protein
MIIEPATLAFKEDICPCIGIDTISSQVSLISLLKPLSSPPMTMTLGPVKIGLKDIPAAGFRSGDPATLFLQIFEVCTKLLTLATGTYSAAPAEVFITAGVSPTLRRLGMITP